MPDFIYDFVLMTIIGGVIVGLILIALKKIKIKTIFVIRRITRLLKRYEKIKFNLSKEEEYVRKFGFLLDSGVGKLRRIGFSIIHIQPARLQVTGEPRIRGDTIKDNNFEIHLTRKYPDIIVKQFLIRRLDNGQKKEPEEAYSSEEYPESQKESSITQVLYDFIEYLKNKRKISKVFNFLRIKKIVDSNCSFWFFV